MIWFFQHPGYGVDVRKRNIWDLYGSDTVLKVKIYIFIAVALDETNLFVAVHFSMKNIYQSCLGRAMVEQRQCQPIKFFLYCRLLDIGHVSPWH